MCQQWVRLPFDFTFDYNYRSLLPALHVIDAVTNGTLRRINVLFLPSLVEFLQYIKSQNIGTDDL